MTIAGVPGPASMWSRIQAVADIVEGQWHETPTPSGADQRRTRLEGEIAAYRRMERSPADEEDLQRLVTELGIANEHPTGTIGA